MRGPSAHASRQDHAQTYLAWSRKYGPVFKVRLGEREVVVVNTAAASKELFNDQGSTYISRPLFNAFHKVRGCQVDREGCS